MKLNISGRIVEVEDSFKDLAPEDQDAAVDEIATSIGISAKPTPKEPEVIQRSAGDYVKDLAVPLFGGLARGGQTIAGLADIVNTPIRAGVEAITGRPAGTVTGALKEMGVDFNAANQAAEDLQSDASKEEAAKVDAAFNEGLLEGGRELFRNPMQIAEGVAGTIPDLASMGMAVKGIAMKIYKEAAEAAIKNGASREVAEQIAKEALKKKAPELAAKSQIIEGAYTAGSDAGAKAADGLTAEETGFSLAKGAATTLGGKLANKIGGKIGLEDIEAAAATDSIAGSMKNRVNLFLQRGASEALEEAPQGVMERMVDNLENGRPIMEGTGRNAVEGAITGAFAGGGMSLAERRGSAAPGREYSDAEMGRKPEPERPASLEQLRDPEAWAQKQAEMAGQPKQITDEKIIYADSPGKVERESARVERRNRQQQEGPVIAQGSDQKRLGHEGMIYAQPPEYYDAIKTKLDAGEELTTAENRAIAENPEAVANARVLPSPEEKAEIDQRIAVSEQKAAQAKIKQVEKLVSSAEKGLDKAVEHFGRDSKEASIAAENLLLTKRELKKYTQKPVEESKKEVPAEEKQTEEAAPEDIEISVQERQDIEEIEKKARADSAKEGLSSARKNVAKAEKDFRGVADLYATDPKRIAAENNLVLARREFFKAKEKVTAAEKDSKAVARVAAEVTKTEKPGYNHPTVDRFMQGLIDNWGYDSEGGRIITRENVDYQGQGPQVVGKTKWIPKSEHMISGYSKEYLRQAWEKAKSGQKLGHAQKALVDGLVDSIIEENPSAFADDDPNADLPWAYRRRGLTKNSRRAQNENSKKIIEEKAREKVRKEAERKRRFKRRKPPLSAEQLIRKVAEGELPVTRLFQNASNEAGTAAPERKVPVDKTPARKLAGAKKYVEPGSDSSTVKNVPRTEDSAAPSEKLPPRRVERVPPKGTRARQDYDTRMGRDPWLLKKGVMGEGVSVDDVKSAIEKEAPGLAGHVTVVKTADDLPKAHIEFFKKNGENLSKIDGYYTKGKGGAIGKAYVIAGNADSIDSAIRAVLHEVAGHKALHLFLGKEGERIMRMAYGSRDLSELRKSVEKKYVLEKDAAKKTGDMRQYEALIGEEMLAELAELDVKKMSPEKRSIFSRAISRIRSLIGKHFGINNYTRDDAIKLLKDAREFLESSKTDSKNDVGVGAVLSKKDQTKTPAFKKWFGDSKVVDADGKPLVVYHGTASDFTIFDRSMLGSSTGDAASYEGFFFSKEADTARLYAQEASYQRDRKKYDDGSRGVIYPVFLSIKNPLMVSYGESVNPETIQSAKSGGYDGVIDDRGDFVVFDPAQIKSAIGNRGTFDPDNPNIMLSKKSDTPDMFGGGDGGMDDMFGGQEDVIQPEKKKVYTGPRGTKEEQPDMFDAKLSRQAAKEAIDSALPSLSKEKLDKLSKRIGSGYRRWLTKEAGLPDDFFQAKVEGEGKRSMLVDVEAKYQAAIFKNAVQKAYGVPYRKLSDQQKHELNKALQGEKAKIPASAEALVGAMRDSLDAMSDDLVRVQKDMVLVALEAATPAQKSAYMQWLKDGADPEDTRGVPADLVKQTLMAKKIASNKGAYVNRSYQAFDDAEWMDKVMDDKRVIDNAARLLGSEGDPDPMATIKHILSEAKGKASPFDFIASEGKKMGIFKRRKDIPVEIRELLGEYKEPLLNYERSLSKMANIISNHHALMGMREAGLDSGLLSKKPTKDKYVEIKGGQSLTPLSGLYTTPEIAQAIEDYTKPEVFSGWLRALGWFNSTIKVGKTVYSDITQARNLLSNVALAISNGHINPEHLKESIKIAVVGAYDPSKMDRALIGMLTERGLINNSAINKELQEQVKEALGGKEPSGPAMLLKVISDIAQVTYGLSDNIWKINGYLHELDRAKAKGLHDEAAAKEAASRVINVYPSYNMIPQAMQKLRRMPIGPSFVSWPWEILRTTKNQAGYIAKDMKEGHYGDAAVRAVGNLVAGAFFSAIAKASMAKLGLDDEDDEALKTGMPAYRKFANIYYYRDEEGNLRGTDLSAYDPRGNISKVVKAAMSGNGSPWDAIKEMLGPFFGVQIGTRALIDAYTGFDSMGNKIWDKDTDTDAEIAQKSMVHIAKQAEPGVGKTLEILYKSQADDINPLLEKLGWTWAMTEDTTRGGRKFTAQDAAGRLAGLSTFTSDPSSSAQNIAYKYVEARNAATQEFMHAMTAGGVLQPSAIKKAVSSYVSDRERSRSDMRKYSEALQKSGLLKEKEIFAIISPIVGKSDSIAIIKGVSPGISRDRAKAIFETSFRRLVRDGMTPEEARAEAKRRVKLVFEEADAERQ